MNPAMSLERVSACTLCPELGQHHVPSWGNEGAEVMVIGQSPGAEEVEQGVPFIGQSGRLLTYLLDECGLTRDDVYIANLLKCHPPENRPGKAKERKTCFEQWLKKEIAVVSPKVILLLGREAWQTFLSKRTKFLHGGVLRTTRSWIVSKHPAFFLRKGSPGSFLSIGQVLLKELEFQRNGQ